MIQFHGVAKQYGPQVLFEDLDWHIKRDQRVGLIGPNGAGKSTLIKMITGNLAPDAGTVRITRGVTVGYLPQEIATISGHSVRDEARKGIEAVLALAEELRLAEARLATDHRPALLDEYAELQARFEALDGFSAEARVEEVLMGLGFTVDQFDVDCGTLSGGWQMRVALARLLLARPDVLLLDEPTNHLDLESVVWLEGFLSRFPGSLVFISHDRRFLNRLSSHIAELSQAGLTVYTGDFESYLKQVETRRALMERQQATQQRRAAQLERFVERFRYKASKASQVQSRVKMLEKMERIELDRDGPTIRFNLPPPPKSGRLVMSLVDAWQGYDPDRLIYRGLQVELLRGQHIALVGPNGAGKSTLLKILAGVVPLQKGQRELGFQVKPFYFAQHQVEVLDPNLSVYQEVEKAAQGQTVQQIRALLGAFLFDSDGVKKKIAVLSGGEKNRVALVKMLLTPANVLLLDEPTTHLDMASRAVLEAAIAEYQGAVLIISHDRHFIDAVVDQVWEVQKGRVTPFPGTHTEYLARLARGDRPEPFLLAGERPGRAPVIERVAVEKSVSRKDEKRAAAEARQRRATATRGLKKALDAAEAEVQRLEAEIERLHQIQADPAHYGDPDAVRTVARTVSEAEAALEIAYETWESAGTALEEAEAAF